MFCSSLLLSLGLVIAGPSAASGAAPVKVVTSLTTYGAIAREIVGDRGTVTSIAEGDEDPHFVQPKAPSPPSPGFARASSTIAVKVACRWVRSWCRKVADPDWC